MSIFSKTMEPSEVFTPRSHEVNSVMYVNRPEHEGALRRAVKTGYNIVVFGDSGCGKSWLYKKVFGDDNIHYQVVDFSAAQDADEVDIQILEAAAAHDEWVAKSKTTKGGLQAKPAGVGGGYEESVEYVKPDASPFIQLLASVRRAAGKRAAFIVFENLEYVLGKPEIVRKIQMMLLALDDPSIGKYRVRICLVGVPTEIKEVLSDGNKYQTISNRVYEVPEVNRLTRKSVDMLVVRGLEQQLEYTVESKTFCCSKIAFVTYRIPQYVHDVCLHVALRAEDAFNTVNPDIVDAALEDWISSNSRQSIEFIRTWVMNDKSLRNTKSKIIYAISRLEKQFFSAADINAELKEHFPISIGERRVQTLATLRKMTEGEERLLKCDADKQLFRVATPQIRSGLRICLKKDANSEAIDVKAI